jgi:membrane fusion protein
LNAKAQRKTLARQELDIRQQIQTAKQNLAQLPLDLATQTNTIAGKIATIKQQLAQNEAERASVLRAPRDGVVATLLTKVGQHVAAGQSLASVVPHGGHLEARLLVPSRAVGFVDPGSRVVLRYQAYPYQKFGQQYGHVARISNSALGPEAVVAMTGQRPQEPVYRVDVALDRQDILAYGKPQALRPGMAFSADILMDRRRLIEWIFEPLYGIGRRLQGEDNNNG